MKKFKWIFFFSFVFEDLQLKFYRLSFKKVEGAYNKRDSSEVGDGKDMFIIVFLFVVLKQFFFILQKEVGEEYLVNIYGSNF